MLNTNVGKHICHFFFNFILGINSIQTAPKRTVARHRPIPTRKAIRVQLPILLLHSEILKGARSQEPGDMGSSSSLPAAHCDVLGRHPLFLKLSTQNCAIVLCNSEQNWQTERDDCLLPDTFIVYTIDSSLLSTSSFLVYVSLILSFRFLVPCSQEQVK